MKSKGLKADTVKYTNIDPAARIGMLVAKKIPAIETFAMSMPGVVKAAGGAEAQIFLLANAGLSLYSNGILVREDYLKAEPAKVKAFVKASLQGWKDTIANPKEAADIVGKHIKGLDADVVLQEIIIVNALVATPEARAKGLGTIDAKVMADERRSDRQEHRRRAARSRRRTCTTPARCRSRRSSRDRTEASGVRRSRSRRQELCRPRRAGRRTSSRWKTSPIHSSRASSSRCSARAAAARPRCCGSSPA